jgi:hypothetical protein
MTIGAVEILCLIALVNFTYTAAHNWRVNKLIEFDRQRGESINEQLKNGREAVVALEKLLKSTLDQNAALVLCHNQNVQLIAELTEKHGAVETWNVDLPEFAKSA